MNSTNNQIDNSSTNEVPVVTEVPVVIGDDEEFTKVTRGNFNNKSVTLNITLSIFDNLCYFLL